jgi:hypothetical protein
MADKSDPTDLVLTLLAYAAGKKLDDQEVRDALAKGYRVLDVIHTPVPPGAESNTSGSVLVSVVLTLQPDTCPYNALARP